MKRREFLQRLGATGFMIASVTAGGLLLHNRKTGLESSKSLKIPQYHPELGASDVQMSIARGNDADKMVKAALGEMGGIGKFIKKGDVVFIKPNVAFDRAPRLGATTNPEVVAAVVKACQEAGVQKILVGDNPINSPESCFYKSGIKQVVEKSGAQIIYPTNSAFEIVQVGGKAISKWQAFYSPFKQTTKLIGIAPVKDHNLCHASMSMKNWYGLLGEGRNRFHQKIHDVIADFALMIKPTLVFLDGTRVLMRNGPTGGSLSDVAEGNTIACGVDMVALDSFGYSELLKRNLNELEYVHKAHERGLGNKNWKSLNYREVTV